MRISQMSSNETDLFVSRSRRISAKEPQPVRNLSEHAEGVEVPRRLTLRR